MISLETIISRMTGMSLTPPADYPEPGSVPVYLVCPHCRYIPTFYIQRQRWECHRCQRAVQPMKSAVFNAWPYQTEIESA